jgi:large subunit ribosomal protein L15
MLDKLKAPPGANRNRKRVGRGRSSGHGKTAGRGGKGQIGRSGGRTVRGFEGGQMEMQRRLPKVGFKNPFRKTYAEVNVGTLSERFPADALVDTAKLLEAGIIHKALCGVKVLGQGELKHALTVKAKLFSKAAKAKIEAAGGSAEVG